MSSKVKTNQKSVKQGDNLQDKLRILCLHGYRQNGEAFRAKIGKKYLNAIEKKNNIVITSYFVQVRSENTLKDMPIMCSSMHHIKYYQLR